MRDGVDKSNPYKEKRGLDESSPYNLGFRVVMLSAADSILLREKKIGKYFP